MSGVAWSRPALDRNGTIIAVATVVAVVLRGYPLVRLTTSNGYDGPVYFNAAVQLVHGELPYRDFVLVHPPLIAVLLAPVALLAHLVGTAGAFTIARWVTVLVGAAAVVLIGLLLRRFGTPAVVVGCGVLALHGSAVVSAQTVLLEPYLVVLLLAALLVLVDGTASANGGLSTGLGLAGGRRQFWAGVLVGLACAVKIWAVVPAVAFAIVAAVLPAAFPAAGGRRRAQVGRLVGGLAAGFVVPVLPFFAAAPGHFVHDVFVSQLQRSQPRDSTAKRVVSLLGMGGQHDWPTGLVVGGLAIVALTLAAYGWMACTHRVLRDPVTVFTLVATPLVTAMFFVPDGYYVQYGGFFAPFLAMLLARPAGEVLAAARAVARESVVPAAVYAPAAVAAVATAVTAGMIVGSGSALASDRGTTIPVSRIDAAIPPGSCVISNSSLLVLATDRATSQQPCSAVVDAVGVELVYADGRIKSDALGAVHLKQYWRHALASAQFLLLSQDKRLQPMGTLRPILAREFHRVALPPGPGIVLWQRNSGAPTARPDGRQARRS